MAPVESELPPATSCRLQSCGDCDARRVLKHFRFDRNLHRRLTSRDRCLQTFGQSDTNSRRDRQSDQTPLAGAGPESLQLHFRRANSLTRPTSGVDTGSKSRIRPTGSHGMAGGADAHGEPPGWCDYSARKFSHLRALKTREANTASSKKYDLVHEILNTRKFCT
jgi:hypothetical protein